MLRLRVIVLLPALRAALRVALPVRLCTELHDLYAHLRAGLCGLQCCAPLCSHYGVAIGAHGRPPVPQPLVS